MIRLDTRAGRDLQNPSLSSTIVICTGVRSGMPLTGGNGTEVRRCSPPFASSKRWMTELSPAYAPPMTRTLFRGCSTAFSGMTWTISAGAGSSLLNKKPMVDSLCVGCCVVVCKKKNRKEARQIMRVGQVSRSGRCTRAMKDGHELAS